MGQSFLAFPTFLAASVPKAGAGGADQRTGGLQIRYSALVRLNMALNLDWTEFSPRRDQEESTDVATGQRVRLVRLSEVFSQCVMRARARMCKAAEKPHSTSPTSPATAGERVRRGPSRMSGAPKRPVEGIPRGAAPRRDVLALPRRSATALKGRRSGALTAWSMAKMATAILELATRPLGKLP
jgi:hypothetical protein